MHAVEVDPDRRRFLVNATATVALVGIASSTVPFLASWQPTQATQLNGLPVRIDLSKIEAGSGIKFLRRGTPMWVIRRDQAMTAQLKSLRDKLKDPDSAQSEQPAYVNRATRSRREDVMVLTAICTHLGCIPELRPAGDGELGADLHGGFFCACHGSRYDSAGRVLKGSPAASNLPIPAHYFTDDVTLIIGSDGAKAW